MGLDTTHDCWHGAYSAFNRWRDKLWEVAGHDVAPYSYVDMQMVGGPILNWDKYNNDDYLYGNPDLEIPDEPLILLVAHSDCDGYIYPKQAKALADRLDELWPKLEGLDGGGHVGDFQTTTMRFIVGLKLAAKRNEKVGFH